MQTSVQGQIKVKYGKPGFEDIRKIRMSAFLRSIERQVQLKHHGIVAQQVDLGRPAGLELVGQGDDGGRRKTVVVEGHLVLEFTNVAVEQSGGPFKRQGLDAAYAVVHATPGVEVGAGLAKGVAEKNQAIELAVGEFALQAHQQHVLVFAVLMKMIGVGAELPLYSGAGATVCGGACLRHGQASELGHNQACGDTNQFLHGAGVNGVMQRLSSVTAGVIRICRFVGGGLLLCSLLCTSGCAWLDVRQRQIIYRPTPGEPADFAGLRASDERYFVKLAAHGAAPAGEVDRDAEQIEMWWLPQADKQAPTLLYFHGTFRNLAQNLHKMEALRDAGFSVLAVEYRGWGLSTPMVPSEQSILQDAALAWTELQRREPRAAMRVIYGHSMGSGVAVDLASRLSFPADYGALILESAFTSFADVAYEAGWFARLASLFNQERFASIEKIAKVHAPLLMIHGTADDTIPLKLGQRLFDAASPAHKQWLTIEGGAHSDLDQVGQAAYQSSLQTFRQQYLSAR